MNGPAKRWPWAAGAIGTLFILAWLLSPSTRTQPLRWEEVRRADLVVELVETGEIRAVQAQTVAAPFEWRADLQIIDMAPEGSQVRKGDFLVQLDTGFLERELQETESNLEGDLAELRRLTAEQQSRRQALRNDLTTAELAREQAELQLQKLRYESAARREQARLALQKAIISLEKARAKLQAQSILDSLETHKVQLKIEKGRGRVKEVQRQIQALTLRAPLSGLVVYHERRWDGTNRKPRVGEKVNPGETIIEIPDLSLMEVVFRVNEVDREKVQEGLPVQVTLEAFPERTFKATIARISRLAERKSSKSQVKEFEVHATIEGTDPVLKPGMTAQVRVQLATHSDAILIPLTAVFEKGGAPVVFPKQKWPKPIRVDLGPRNDLYVVAHAGVEPGVALATVRPPEAEDIRLLGYTEYQRYLELREEEVRRHFEELERRGITFDYTTFRKEGKSKRQATIRTDPGGEVGRKIVLPGGGEIELPSGAIEKLRQAGKASAKTETVASDSSRLEQKASPRTEGPAAAADSIQAKGQNP